MTGPQIVTVSPGIRSQVDAFFAGYGQGLNAGMLGRARLRRIVYLSQLSDEDLEVLGLTRDRIVAHVFRDLIAI